MEPTTTSTPPVCEQATTFPHFTVQRKALLNAVKALRGVMPARPTRPVLSNIKATATGESLKLFATDMDERLSMIIPAQIEQDGGGLLPAAQLYALLKGSSAKDVSLQFGKDSHGIDIVAVKDGGKYTLICDDPDHFPSPSDVEPETVFSVKTADLRKAYQHCSPAVAREDLRYPLKGLYLELELNHSGDLYAAMVGTDGKRMHISECPVSRPEYAKGNHTSAIIPPKALSTYLKAAPKDGLTTIGWTGKDPDPRIVAARFVTLDGGTVHFAASIMEGTYPDWRETIPTGGNKRLKINSKTLTKAAKQVQILTSEDSRAVLLNLTQGNLALSASSPEAGKAGMNLPVDYQDEDFAIRIDPQWLLDICKGLGDVELTFTFKAATTPILVEADGNLAGILMPINVE